MKQPKILLINPSLTGSLESGIFTIKTPLGLAYIAAYLEKLGYAPKIVDSMAYYDKIKQIDENTYCVGLPDEELIKIIREFQPDVVGISGSFTVYEADTFRTADIVKANSNAIVVCGGAHSSANPGSVLKNKNVDFLVIGEGEVVFSKIVKNYNHLSKIKLLNGVAYRTKNGIKVNKSGQFIENLDELPMPARHLLPMERYLNHPQNSVANMRGPTTEIITSRGCPFNCIFCSIKTVWGRTWRARSAKNVVDELEYMNKKYGIKEFRFFDDNISWNKKRMMDICNEIINRKLNIRWDTPNGVAITTLDEEVLRKMKQSGYYKIVMGIESGSERTLRFMRKPLVLSKAREIIKICNKLGIWTWSTFVIGFPDEKMEDIQKTMEFTKKSGLNFVTIYVAQPYAGTELYGIYEKEGLLKGGPKMHSSVINTQYNTKHFSAEELREMQKKIYSEFIRYRALSYLNPVKLYGEFLNRIRSFEDLSFVFRMVISLIRKDYKPNVNKIKS